MTRADMLNGFSGLISQTKETTQTFDAPVKEAVDATSLSSDGKDFADTVFTGGTRIPAREMCDKTAYDISQSYARLMKLYSYSRTDFYNIAVPAGVVRQERLAAKGALLDSLAALGAAQDNL